MTANALAISKTTFKPGDRVRGKSGSGARGTVKAVRGDEIGGWIVTMADDSEIAAAWLELDPVTVGGTADGPGVRLPPQPMPPMSPTGPLARPSSMLRSHVNIRIWSLLAKAWDWHLVPIDKAEEFLADLTAAVGATRAQAHIEARETAQESGYRSERDLARAELAEVRAERDALVRIIARQT